MLTADFLKQYVRDLIEESRTPGNEYERSDLLSNLLEANADTNDDLTKLSDEELIGIFYLCVVKNVFFWPGYYAGNVFILLLAGHEVRCNLLICITAADNGALRS